MEQYFYVLYNVEDKAFYIDTEFCRTTDMLMAERYESCEEAKKDLSYFYSPEEWEVKKVTMRIEL